MRANGIIHHHLVEFLMRVWTWAIGLSLFLSTGSYARASLIVTIGSANISPGGSATADVFIRSTTGADVLDNFSLHFQLTPVGPVSGATVGFANPQSDSQLTKPGYILFGNSQAATFGSFTSVASLPKPNDTYFGGDGTLSGLGVLLPTTNLLLARLDLTTSLGTPGGRYQISLVGDAFTAFNDPDFNSLTFTSLAGQASVVPEPATFLSCAFMFALAGWYFRRHALGMV